MTRGARSHTTAVLQLLFYNSCLRAGDTRSEYALRVRAPSTRSEYALRVRVPSTRSEYAQVIRAGHTRRSYAQVHMRRYICAGTYAQVHMRRYIRAGTYAQVHTRRYIRTGHTRRSYAQVIRSTTPVLKSTWLHDCTYTSERRNDKHSSSDMMLHRTIFPGDQMRWRCNRVFNKFTCPPHPSAFA